MPRRPDRKLSPADLPRHTFHRSSGCGRIRFRGATYWTGMWRRKRGGKWVPSPEAEARYRALCSEILSHGSVLPAPAPTESPEEPGLTVVELVAAYLDYCARVRYHGKPGSLEPIRAALSVLLEVAPKVEVAKFSRRDLIRVRDAMLSGRPAKRKPGPKARAAKAGASAKGKAEPKPEWKRRPWARSTTNAGIATVKRMFRWGNERELVPDAVCGSIERLANLRAGESAAAEPRRVEPASEADLDRILAHLSSVVRAMVQLQRLTAMRPGELCQVRAIDLDMKGKVWWYRPKSHKLQSRGKDRVVAIGPRGQELLAPFLQNRPVDATLFSPRESAAEFRAAKTSARKVPLSCGNTVGSNRRRRPKRAPRDAFDTSSYRDAVQRACDKAGVSPIAPNRIRHSAACRIRSEFGLDVAQQALGHATVAMTQHYARPDPAKLMEAAAIAG